MNNFHQVRRSVAALIGSAITVAGMFAAGIVAPSSGFAVAEDSTDPPSVAGHAYDQLPYTNPTVSVTQIDNSAKPAYLRNPIGQDEGTNTPDDLTKNYYSADAAPVEYDGKLFVYTGHDNASPTEGGFNMQDWGVYVTDDPASGKWTHYRNVAQANLFSWSTGDGAYAGQVVVDDNGTPNDTSDDWFYYYIPVKDKNAAAGADPFSIGVAKSKSPLGPWKDAIGEPLLTTTQTKIETIDPAFFVDADGTGYLHFGTFNSQLAVKMRKETNGRTSYTRVETSDGSDAGDPVIHNMRDVDGLRDAANYDPEQDTLGSAYSSTVLGNLNTNGGAYANGPKGFFEASWVFRNGDTYYNVYDGGKPGSGNATCVESNYQACVQYSTSKSPLGPWTYQGVVVDAGSATTMHPSVVPFNGQWWVTYHTADKTGGTDFRRSVSIDAVDWRDGLMSAVAHPTKAERIQPSRNVAPYAKVSATYTETASYKGSVNDGRVLETAVVPPNHWDNYRKMPQPQSGDSLIYQWDGAVRIGSAKVWFDTDANALRAPASWKLQYLAEDGTWNDVPNPSAYTRTTGKASPNTVRFDAVTTTALKLDMTGQAVTGGYASVAVPEWEVDSADEQPVVAEPKGVTTKVGAAPALPASVNVAYGARTISTPVIWRPVDEQSYTGVPDGTTFKAYGVVAGVAGEQSEHGNVALTVTVKAEYAPTDTAKPVATVALAGTAGKNGWLVTSPVAIVGATDDSATPMARLELSTDSGATWRSIAAGSNTANSVVSGEGALQVWVRATDAAGNVSDIAKATANVDNTAPTIIAQVDATARSLTLTAADGGGSGVDALEYRIGDEGDWRVYGATPITAPTASRTTVYYRAMDAAGNISAVQNAVIPADASVPLTGYIEQDALAADPGNKASSWTKGVKAINDGTTLADGCTNGNDCIWGTWPSTGELTLEYTWDRAALIDSSRVQFTSDGGGLGIPASWKLQYWNDDTQTFMDIPDATYAVTSNAPGDFGTVNEGWSDGAWTTPVSTTRLRMVIQSGTASPAVVEWQVHAAAPKPTVDKTLLDAAISSAGGLQETEYTADSWKVFAEALSQARSVLADEKASQADVDAAVKALDAATSGLVKAGGDTTPDGSKGSTGSGSSGTSDTSKGGALSATGSAVAAVAGLCVLLVASGMILVVARKRHDSTR